MQTTGLDGGRWLAVVIPDDNGWKEKHILRMDSVYTSGCCAYCFLIMQLDDL